MFDFQWSPNAWAPKSLGVQLDAYFVPFLCDQISSLQEAMGSELHVHTVVVDECPALRCNFPIASAKPSCQVDALQSHPLLCCAFGMESVAKTMKFFGQKVFDSVFDCHGFSIKPLVKCTQSPRLRLRPSNLVRSPWFFTLGLRFRKLISLILPVVAK